MESLFSIYISFAKVGVMLFGGGYSMLPILEREIVEKHGWVDEEELTDYYAIGQCTPGIIAVNTATFIGMKLRGVAGAIVATLGVVTPSLFIIMALAKVISMYSGNPYVEKAFMGIRVCVCVLIFNAITKLWKSSIKDKVTFGVFLFVSLISLFLKVSPVSIVIVCMCIGILIEKGKKA